MRPQLPKRFLVMLWNLQGALLDSSGGGDEVQLHARRRHRDDLDMAYHGVTECRVLHDCHLLGDLRQQSDRAQQHIIEIKSAGEERLDRTLLCDRQRLEGAEAVDEKPVALVCRNTASAGVRLHDVALFLKG